MTGNAAQIAWPPILARSVGGRLPVFRDPETWQQGERHVYRPSRSPEGYEWFVALVTLVCLYFAVRNFMLPGADGDDEQSDAASVFDKVRDEGGERSFVRTIVAPIYGRATQFGNNISCLA